MSVGAGVVKAGPGAHGPRLAFFLAAFFAPPPFALLPTPDAALAAGAPIRNVDVASALLQTRTTKRFT